MRRQFLLAATLGLLGTPLRAVTQPERGGPRRAAPVPAFRLQVLRSLPHDPTAFTQGLLLHAGKFYESTGLNGRSTLRRVDPNTGVVEKSVALADTHFGEGLALVGERLIQLTWRSGLAFVYDRASFRLLRTFRYAGEGWGLTWDGRRLIMSDGSDRLVFRDPDTFQVNGEVAVRYMGRPLPLLNELEFIDGMVYANVLQTEQVVIIDPVSGAVTGVIDASGLLLPGQAEGVDVLNGIAWNPATRTLFLTGKLWPKVFEARLVPA